MENERAHARDLSRDQISQAQGKIALDPRGKIVFPALATGTIVNDDGNHKSLLKGLATHI